MEEVVEEEEEWEEVEGEREEEEVEEEREEEKVEKEGGGGVGGVVCGALFLR